MRINILKRAVPVALLLLLYNRMASPQAGPINLLCSGGDLAQDMRVVIDLNSNPRSMFGFPEGEKADGHCNVVIGVDDATYSLTYYCNDGVSWSAHPGLADYSMSIDRGTGTMTILQDNWNGKTFTHTGTCRLAPAAQF